MCHVSSESRMNSMKPVIPSHFILWKTSLTDISRKCILPNINRAACTLIAFGKIPLKKWKSLGKIVQWLLTPTWPVTNYLELPFCFFRQGMNTIHLWDYIFFLLSWEICWIYTPSTSATFHTINMSRWVNLCLLKPFIYRIMMCKYVL